MERLFRDGGQVVHRSRETGRVARTFNRSVSRRDAGMLLALAAIWGASFMFIRVADRELDPATLIAGRIGLAAVTLWLIVPALLGGRRTLVDLRRHGGRLAVVGLLNTAVPFWLLSWGETRIDSGLAAIIQGAVPIFLALLAFAFVPAERVTGLRLVGLLVGFLGVALLVGVQPGGQVLAALAVVGMAFFYAVGGLLAGQWLRDCEPLVIALGTTTAAAFVVLGPGIARAPDDMPGWKTIGSVLTLAVVGTALAYLLFFALIRGAGAGRASLVTYLVPPFALAYGAGILDESIDASAIVGLALILGGVALSARGRRQAVAEVTAESA
jgi:drug/metabolite transporter (DMT)-like permease